MNMISRTMLVDKLVKSISKFKVDEHDFFEYDDLNVFFNLLKGFDEKDLLKVITNKKVFVSIRTISSYSYDRLSIENKLICEQIDKLLYLNGLKELKFCQTFIKDVWKENMMSNPKELIQFQGELDDEMQHELINIIKEDPNLIYQYRGRNEEIISEAFSQNSEIEIKLADLQSLNSHNKYPNYNFYNNPNFFVKYIETYGNDFNNLQHENIWKILKEKIKNIRNDVSLPNKILSSERISGEFLTQLISEAEYKNWIDHEYFTPEMIASKPFQIFGTIYGAQEIKVTDDNCLVELYKYDKEFFLKNSQNIILTRVVKGERIGAVLKVILTSESELESAIEFLNAINYEYIKEDIINYPDLYKKIPISFIFTLDDFQKYSLLGKSDRVVSEAIEYLPIEFLNYVYYPINEEIIKKAIEKGFEFKTEHYARFGHSEVLLNYLIEKQNYEVLFKFNDIKDVFYEYALSNGFSPTIEDIKQYAIFCDKDCVIKSMLKDGIIDAIFYYTGENLDLYKYALENDLKDRKIDYTSNQRAYLKFIIKHSEVLTYCQNNYNNIISYFDELGPKAELFKKMFNDKMWDLLIKINDEKKDQSLNEKERKALEVYSKLDHLQSVYQDFIIEEIDNLSLEKLETLGEVLYQISISNSNEIQRFKESLAREIIALDDPITRFKEVEEIFIKNNLPTVGKIYSVFQTLHPNFSGFSFESDRMSPVLKSSNNRSRDIIIFSDLIKCAFGSNNRSVKSYLDNIELATKLYREILSNSKDINSLTNEELTTLEIFRNHLLTLYNNSLIKKRNLNELNLNNNPIEDITTLAYLISPNESLDYKLEDRIIKMFCHFAGFDTFDSAKQYFNQKSILADERGRRLAESKFTLDEGDFVKGIGDIKYLNNIFQTGSVAKEYLGSSSTSDLTPLDTDLSRIIGQYDGIEFALNSTEAKGYGEIYFVLKNNKDRFNITRNDLSLNETASKLDLSKLEIFYTGAVGRGHYGIRTGFASSEIDYIICENDFTKVALEIVMNGFYIPIVNKSGELLFSPKDYDLLKAKMQGLTYFENNEFIFADNLYSEGVQEYLDQLDQNNVVVLEKRTAINKHIEKVINSLGLSLKTYIDGDLSNGVVELIDTGSTGRGTNKPGDGDFDFMMRLDKSILTDDTQFNKLKQALDNSFTNVESRTKTGNGDFRFKNVTIEGLSVPVDIDITFSQKTNAINYSTDMCLQDRLGLIKEKYPDKYNLVVANILLAKSVLKNGNVYKPNRGENPQGGLGGVGIENWILQNGGSFIKACEEFLKCAEGKSFSEFKKSYQIWDFGENHVSAKVGRYLHDNFVENNMSKEGYEKMVGVLKEYLYGKEYEQEINQSYSK